MSELRRGSPPHLKTDDGLFQPQDNGSVGYRMGNYYYTDTLNFNIAAIILLLVVFEVLTQHVFFFLLLLFQLFYPFVAKHSSHSGYQCNDFFAFVMSIIF